jgi:hypothetical protein
VLELAEEAGPGLQAVAQGGRELVVLAAEQGLEG